MVISKPCVSKLCVNNIDLHVHYISTSVPTDPCEIAVIQNTIQSQCREQDTIDHYIDSYDVRLAISKLKAGKADGLHGFRSDHLKNASDNINCMLTHGYNPSQLLRCTIISIPKDRRGSLKRSDYYRGISLVNSICKLVDILIIAKCQAYMHTSDLQFAFKRDHSTVLCTAVLLKTVSHFTEGGSNVYACLLDASKAFDKVNYGKLFTLLLNRKMPAIFLRLILDSYLRQYMMTKWNNCLSTRFSVTNGVKQGGVLSPLLFIIYFDEMISRLKNSGIGCTIGGKLIGALCYADDLTLLSPSINGLSSMICTCEAFANEYNVVFNQKKPVGIQFGRTSSYTINGVTLNGCLIGWCTKVKHLGNVVNSRLTDNDDCKNKRSILIGNVNRFIGSYNALSVSTKCKLYKAYCTNFYGSELWQCNSRGFKMCCTEWRKATRRIFNLPYMAHSYILGPLCGQSSIKG